VSMKGVALRPTGMRDPGIEREPVVHVGRLLVLNFPWVTSLHQDLRHASVLTRTRLTPHDFPPH
jgi:hypothetical protein